MDTKYHKAWSEYLAEHPEIDEKQAQAMVDKMAGYEGMMLGFILFLCV